MDSNQAALRQGVPEARSDDAAAEPSSLLQPAVFEASASLRVGMGEAGATRQEPERPACNGTLSAPSSPSWTAASILVGIVGWFHVSTDDAYVEADIIVIAPKMSGLLAMHKGKVNADPLTFLKP